MNYTIIYNQLVNKVLSENRKKPSEAYFESHHIIPSCMGGSDDKENRVLFTPREHYIAHYLLYKIYPEHQGIRSGLYGMQMRGSQKKRILKSHQYDNIRKKMIEDFRNRPAWNKSLKMKKLENSHKEKISKTLKDFWKDKPGNRKGEAPWNKGIKGAQEAWNKGKKIKTISCPHCSIVGQKSNMNRWHFDNCKFKKQ